MGTLGLKDHAPQRLTIHSALDKIMMDVRAYKVRMTQMHALPRKQCLKQPFTGSGLSIGFESNHECMNGRVVMGMME